MSYRPGGQVTSYAEGMSSQPSENYSLIDRHSSVEGTYTTERDLRIEGQLRGTLRCQGLLYVAEGADVDATVEASNITVAGRLRGNVTCRGKLQLLPTGHMVASVATESLVINEGAIYEGELRMDTSGRTAALPVSTEYDQSDYTAPPILRRFGPDAGDNPSGSSSGAGPQRTGSES